MEVVYEGSQVDSKEYISAYLNIPYGIIREEIEDSSYLIAELNNIAEYYKVYYKGAKFNTEGTAGNYVASDLRFKKSAQLINKEARFLFGEMPTITIKPKGDIGKVTQEAKDSLTVLQDLVDTVIQKNMFSKNLVKAARDCFIGKRVAITVNFNEVSGITISFFNSLSFFYETDEYGELSKFVCISIQNKSKSLKDKRVYKKKFEKVNGKVYLSEGIYDGAGRLIEELTNNVEILLDVIPAVVILNDGLLGDDDGESEIESLEAYESVFSKLNNADIDAERKGMNQIKYTVDMNDTSTKNLPTGPGSFWDLQSNDNKEKSSPSVGTIPVDMNYSGALTTTLSRIQSEMFGQLEMPDIDLRTMGGIITSGKALKAIYWPLIVRCKEKMKTWGPELEKLFGIIIEGSLLYPDATEKYITDPIKPVNYYVDITLNFPLPEDLEEEKNMALSEVTAQTMSKKAYIKKYGDMTDDEAMQELEQIALERQMLEESYAELPGNPLGEDNKDKSLEEEEINIKAEQMIME